MAMVDVLLTHSNNLFRDTKQVQKMQPYPPLQTITVAAILRQHGLTVDLCDVTFDDPLSKFEECLGRHKPRLVIVCEDGFNFLSKMCLGRNRELALSIADHARSRGILTAAHSSDAADHAAEYINAGFNYVAVGEPETTLLDLAQQRCIEQIHGLAYASQTGPRIRYNPPRTDHLELDALPLPAWDLVAIDQYREAWIRSHGYFSLNMVSSRGCPYRCNWCSKPVFGNSYRVRSAALIAQEFRYLKDKFHPDQIWFADDIFALSRQWALDFADNVEQLGAQIPFKMQSRCDLMTRDTVLALKRAGCAEVWMGAESGSQGILDAMDKSLRVEDVYKARENLRRHNIRVGFFLQFGYPGETWDEIEATVRMVRDTRPDDIGVSVSYPLPGTKFHQLVSAQIGAKSNWSESGELAMMFRGSYSTDFYRALADALHVEVRNPDDDIALRGAWNRVYKLEGKILANAGVC